MKLKDYLNCRNNHHQIIDLIKYEKITKDLTSSNKNITSGILSHNNNILENLSENITIFLSSNPDQDFPNPKKYIFEPNQSQEETDKIPYLERLEIKPFRENLKVFAHAVGKELPNLFMVPIGRDYKNSNLFDYADKLKKSNKNILCYYNCTIAPDVYHWYSNQRREILNILQQKDYVKIEECNVNPRQINQKKTKNYFNNISNSKFMVCPRGCGIDTYRMWDCIYLGCIPIIIKYEGYRQFEDLPILFLEDWKELENIDKEFLEEKWKEMLEKDYNYDKLKTEYWINKILN